MKYVSVYARKGRACWHVSYPDPLTGRRINEGTTFRMDEPRAKRQAFDYAVQKVKTYQALGPGVDGERWEAWVPDWIRIRFIGRTLQHHELRWKHLRFFLSEHGIVHPRAVRYVDAQRYLAWRTAQKRHRGTFIHFNTALCELRLLGSVMREAVRRDYAPGNPISNLGISKHPQALKPEINDLEDARIRSELESRPAWMAECYHIAMCQGCRLTETQVPMARVDLPRGAITFHGKGNKSFTTQIHPALRPLAEAKQKVGAGQLCELPAMAAKVWWQFFREVGMPHLCFHCTKVTVITRLCRAGVPQGIAMSYVNHSKVEVHRVYQRLGLADVGRAVDALSSIPLWRGTPGGPGPTAQTAPGSYSFLGSTSQGVA